MKQFFRAALMLLFCVLLFGFQSALGSRLQFFGAGFDVLPMAAVTAGVLGGAACGGWTGFALGLMADTNRPGGICLYAGIYFLLGALSGYFTKHYLRRGLLTAYLLSIVSLAAVRLGSFALSVLVYRGSFAGYWQEFGLTLAFSTILYLPLYGILRLLDALRIERRTRDDAVTARRIRSLMSHRRERV